MTTFYALFKFIAIFIGGFSGILALLVEFKKEGKITKWGKAALIGVVISFLVTIILQTLEIRRNNISAKAEQQKTQQMFTEISRSANSLKSEAFSIFCKFKIELRSSLFDQYKKRLKAFFDSSKNGTIFNFPFDTKPHFDDDDVRDKKTDKFYKIDIGPNSPLYPNPGTENQVYNLIGQIDFDISMYQKSIIDSLAKSLDEIDSVELMFSSQTISPHLIVSQNLNSIEFQIKDLKMAPSFFGVINKGHFQSLQDLSYAIIKTSLGFNYVRMQNDDAKEILKKVNLQFFGININNRLFSRATNYLHIDEDSGLPTFVIRLPENTMESKINIFDDSE